MATDITDLARRLAREAEPVCRHYLSNGRREGQYWHVGDIRNTPGRSLFVRLTGPAAGKWLDAATGDHGDLLDIIRVACDLEDFRDILGEARRFLCLPTSERQQIPDICLRRASHGSRDAARRLIAATTPISGTIAEAYLRNRGITDLRMCEALGFHARCFYRPDDQSKTQTWPALIATVTDLGGATTGAHRTWLSLDGTDKAPVESPRRALGDLRGHAVRFGEVQDVMAAGEGIETVLSLKMALPKMPLAAALSSSNLGQQLLPTTLRRLYILRDNDPAGERAVETLAARATAQGIEAIVLVPRLGDFNDDLRQFGLDVFRSILRAQLAPGDTIRFLDVEMQASPSA